MDTSRFLPLLIGLLLGIWTMAAAWAVLTARARQKRAEQQLRQARRLGRMVEGAPALPLLVRTDGRIETSPRLAQWLGLDRMPQFLSELNGGGKGFTAEKLEELTEAIRRCHKTASSFRMEVTPCGARRSLALHGCLADPQVSPDGGVLIWVFDYSDSQSELVILRDEASRAREDFHALVSLIQAAPIAMWFRNSAGELQLVNQAYVQAVGAESAEAVVAHGIELIESVEGLSPSQIARRAVELGTPIERTVSTTIGEERRALRVSDLPLSDNGVAGYAIDIEDQEELARSFRGFRDAQRTLVDHLSAGVAQFDSRRRLTFANNPFQSLFKLDPKDLQDALTFERLLDAARDLGRVPEVRDFPAWRREKAAWFETGETSEEPWSLADGTHLRIVAQPVPDGGLMLIVEDRTEQLRLSAMRDTLLRTRATTFDSLFEAIAVFAPNGKMQLWNRRFAEDWGLDAAYFDSHPHIEDVLGKIASHLTRPAEANVIGNAVRAATLDRTMRTGRIALADGRILEFAGVPLPDGNGLLTVLDVTASQRAEDALRNSNNALLEADAIKTRFLANMSKDLRSPLMSIGGFAEMLDMGLGGDLGEDGKDYVRSILHASAQLSEHIDSLLDLSQSEAGLLPLKLEELDPMPFVHGVVEERLSRLQQAGLTVDLQGNDLMRPIQADHRRLARAIGHLVDNAIEASPQGGRILVRVARRKSAVSGSDVLQIVVQDSGAGMDSRSVACAMDGTSLRTEGSDGEPKQGVGLPLARQLVEAHGGNLRLSSEIGKGTQVVIELP